MSGGVEKGHPRSPLIQVPRRRSVPHKPRYLSRLRAFMAADDFAATLAEVKQLKCFLSPVDPYQKPHVVYQTPIHRALQLEYVGIY